RFQDVVGGRFKLIPRDATRLLDFQISDAQWDGLALPINLAFFFQNSATGKMAAIYPGPAGAMESLLLLENWEGLRAANPELNGLKADVEALLINRVGTVRDYYVTPIDLCYELTGVIRS